MSDPIKVQMRTADGRPFRVGMTTNPEGQVVAVLTPQAADELAKILFRVHLVAGDLTPEPDQGAWIHAAIDLVTTAALADVIPERARLVSVVNVDPVDETPARPLGVVPEEGPELVDLPAGTRITAAAAKTPDRPPEVECLDRLPHESHTWTSLRHRWWCPGRPQRVLGVIDETDTALTGPAVHAVTGEVTQPGQPLPPMEQS